jgi:DNA-binding transcriptional ArsR family regulator
MVKHESDELDAIFGALADGTRRRILERLTRGESPVTEVAEPFDMSLPAVSKHLRVLENAGLLRRQRRGREHLLSLEAKPMIEAIQWMERYRKFWDSSLDALANYLEKENNPPADAHGSHTFNKQKLKSTKSNKGKQ